MGQCKCIEKENAVTSELRLISHRLCPYVQRAVIVASEKGIPFERVDIDLARKPDWFLAISPTGKTPLLEVKRPAGETGIIFESAVIAEFLDEIAGDRLLASDPFHRARERAWIEFASATLNSIGQLYLARDRAAYDQASEHLAGQLEQIETEIEGPWFAGERFGLVDAAFGPALRYLDVFYDRAGLDLTSSLPKLSAWAARLAARPSVRAAVSPDYPDLLVAFVVGKGSYLGGLLSRRDLAA
jgi:glutathione S-transferase